MVPFSPKFRDDSNLGAWDATISNGAAYQVLNAICLGSINETVADLQGVDDRGFEGSFVLASGGSLIALLVS